MTAAETLLALAIAGYALYGIGIPLAWLLPAPESAAWMHRIAVGPLYAIVLVTAMARALAALGIPLNPLQLAALLVALWALAWRRAGHLWVVRASLRDAFWPALMIAVAAVVWFWSLVGYGLYLPNRDFKNHAYFVAQVAFTQSADPALVLRASPVSPPHEGGFYPLGLHTLLGWALPTSDWGSLGVTAAAAVLCAAVTLPLSLMVLARTWLPSNRPLWILAGGAGALFPGLTSAFNIGSVVLVCATALYAAGLGVLWGWLRAPTPTATLALGLAGLGLVLLHVSEAWGLLLVAVASLPLARRELRAWNRGRTVIAALLAVGVVLLGGFILRRRVVQLGITGFEDIEANDLSLPGAVVRVFLLQPGGPAYLGLGWMILVCLGVFIVISRRLPREPLVALGVPMALAFLASGSGVPEGLRVLTAPFYGSSVRVYLLAGPPVVLLGGLALSVVWIDILASRLKGRAPSALVIAATALVLGLVAWLGLGLVADRRQDLAATLAGAGDTPHLGVRLREVLKPGETVLNFEGDGTANLFAASRVPILSGVQGWQPGPTSGSFSIELLSTQLANLDDSLVRGALADLQVGYIALGTTSLYWGSQVGYDLDALLMQPQLSIFSVGTDMTILRYEGGGQ